MRVISGLEHFITHKNNYVSANARVGLIANPTAVDAQVNHAIDLLLQHQVHLTTLFGPEHGLRGDAQDMISVTDEQRDKHSGLPVYSLYGHTFRSLEPEEYQLRDVDVLIFDIQDIGSRYYTFAATMALCMQKAAEYHKKMIVLDRPNPIGGLQIEGGGITKGLESFVGLYPLPVRHGLTVGELAQLYNHYFKINCDLQVVPCQYYKRSMYYHETDLLWIMPSPNIPTFRTALVYPGMCLIEGTNVSEGRGTTIPFELVGAPFVDGVRLAQYLTGLDLPGVLFRACAFTPTFHKFSGSLCGAVQLHVTHRDTFLSYRTGLAILVAIKQLWPNEFRWRTDTYEFRKDVPAIDLLTGNTMVREAIDAGKDVDTVYHLGCQNHELPNFKTLREKYLLYT